MSDLDFLFARFGDVNFPVDDVENGQLFSALDPVRDRMLAFFKDAVNQELGGSTSTVTASSAWGTARVGTVLASAQPVQDVCYLAPTPDLMRETNWGMPLLCCYRTSAVHEEFSLQRELIRSTWGVDYILPPLAVDDRRKLAGVLSGVRSLLTLLIRRRSHPAYQNGALIFGSGYGGFDTLKVASSTEGPVAFSDQSGGNYYYALHLDLESVELDDMSMVVDANGNVVPTSSATPFEGADIRVGVGGTDGTLPDAVLARTDTNPKSNYGKVNT